MKDIITKLDQLIAGSPVKKTVQMTKPQFLAHVEAEVKKAMDEQDEDKRKKRLEFVRDTVAGVNKSAWDEPHEAQAIPVYEEPTTAKSESSEATVSGQDGKGSQGDTSMASNEGDILKTLNKTLDAALAPPAAAVPAPAGAAPAFWPTDMNAKEVREGVNKRGGDWGADPSQSQA